MIHRCVSWGLVALVAASAGCFDSDEVFKAAATTTTGDPTTTTTTTATTTTTDPTTESTTFVSDDTCRDAIDCIFECAAMVQAQMQLDPSYEPDLSCFTDCIEQLSVPEATKLLRLSECASMQCEAMNECGMGDTTGGSDTGTGSSGTGSDSGSSSDGGDDGPIPPSGPLTPCLQCIFVLMLDEDFEGCQEFALECQ
jgi:hypothetical protein